MRQRPFPSSSSSRAHCRELSRSRDTGPRQLSDLDGMCHNIYRWERGGPLSERYRLHYCRAFGIQLAQFAPGPVPEPAVEPALVSIPAVATRFRNARRRTGDRPCPPLSRYVPFLGFAVYREAEGPGLGAFSVEREVLMAAHEGSEHAERAERVVHVDHAGPGRYFPRYFVDVACAGDTVPMSMIWRIPASPTRKRTTRCRNARLARTMSRPSGAARSTWRAASRSTG